MENQKRYTLKKLHRMIKNTIVLCNLVGPNANEIRRYLIDAEVIARKERFQ